MRLIAILLVVITIAFPVFAAEKHEPSQKLVQLVQSPDDEDFRHWTLIHTAIDSSPTVASKIAPFLEYGTDRQQWAALRALTYLGGEQALAALQQYYDRTHAAEAGEWLCRALASRGSAEDRAFLIKLVRSEITNDNWLPMNAAVLSLGVLRGREETEALKVAVASSNNYMSYIAGVVLRWTEHGPWAVKVPNPRSPRDQVIAVVLRNGIPSSLPSDKPIRFFESSRGGIWQLANQSWSFRVAEQPKNLSGDGFDVPFISFNVHFNQERTRALVSVGLTFGMLNGSGYDYVLRKDRNGWKVEGIFSTWVS